MAKRSRRAVQPSQANSDPLDLLYSAQHALIKIMCFKDKGRLRHFSVFVFKDAGFYAIYEYINTGVEKRLDPHQWPAKLLKKIG